MGILDWLFKKKRYEGPNVCHFCGKQVHEGKGAGLTKVGDPRKAYALASHELRSRKKSCPKCKAVYCLQCGHDKAVKLDSGTNHACPGCGHHKEV